MSATTTEADVLAFSRVDQEWSQLTPRERTAPKPWRPAVNAYSCQGQFVVFVELAGVPRELVEVSADRRSLTIRGLRRSPEPGCARTDLTRLLALEIDHGHFERTLPLPQDIDPARISASQSEGLLRIDLPLAPTAA